jgi:hypothetical protein
MINNKQKVMLLLGFINVLLVAGGAFFGNSYIFGKRGFNTDVQKMEKLSEKEANLDQESSGGSFLAENYEISLSAIPVEPSVPLFMTQIEVAAKEAGLAVRRLSFVKEGQSRDKNNKNDDGSVATITVNCVFGGDISSLAKYLSFLESSRRLVEVSNVRVNAEKSDKGEYADYEINLTVLGYYMPFKSLKDGEEVFPIDLKKEKGVIGEIASFRTYEIDANQN